ncbi:MAG: hypothetical protein KatS3mg017_1037 [Fimbriimonadales bacterium]|nr:MAG: hypothetical protein KatS3mg017_1037 [Fimbriimonadales bacterium]GIV10190.1 MAG: hypothetical protein KatS3mg019_2281 [Fimbriimonadales bacterium]
MELSEALTIVSKSSIARYAAQLERLLRPTIYLRPVSEQESVPVGACKIGGVPDMPSEFEWPRRDNTPLSFLLQINLSAVKPYDLENWLPNSGMLYFFCATDEVPWGYPDEREAWRVYYYDGDMRRIVSTKPPRDLPHEAQFPEIALAPELTYTLPACTEELEWIAPEFYQQLTEEECDAYLDLCSDLQPYPRHWMLGYHTPIQSPANIEAIQNMHEQPYEQASACAQEMVLLLQLDSDESADMMWGDMGILYFWIHQDDLAGRRFENTWLVQQCY